MGTFKEKRVMKRILRKLNWVAMKVEICDVNWCEKLSKLADLLLMFEAELEMKDERRKKLWKNVFSIKE